MAVSHKHRRTIKVNDREYLWRINKDKSMGKDCTVPTLLEIIDPERRVRKVYSALHRLKWYEWGHFMSMESTRPWDEEEQRLINLGAKTTHKDCVILITPKIVAALIKEDFLQD